MIDLVSDPLLRRVGKVGGEGEVGWEGGYLLPGREGKWVGGDTPEIPSPCMHFGGFSYIDMR